MRNNPFVLRCYIRPEEDHLIAVCVDLDLCVRAENIDSAKRELGLAIKSFFLSLDADNVKDLLPRPSPFYVWLDYYRIVFLVWCLRFVRNAHNSFRVFCETAIPQNFVISHCA